MVTRTFDLLERYKNKFADKEDVFGYKQKGEWVKYSTKDYIDRSYEVSYGLLSMGLRKGDKVVTITSNRPEWNFLDMGMAMIGVVHTPVFTSLSIDEYAYIFKHSEPGLIIVSNASLYKKIREAAEQVKLQDHIYSLDPVDDVKNWKQILEKGRASATELQEEVGKIKEGISEEDFATLIYTSGTTGNSKGVMLSHKNLVKNFLAANAIFGLSADDKYLSILPLCHVGGRMGNYQTQYSGSSIYYAENLGTIASDMKEIRPDGFDAVPRILEKVFDNVLSKGRKLKGIKKELFFWAVNLGLKYKTKDESSFWYRIRLTIADKLIFSKWREALGGNVRLVGCGGASLQPRLERIFWAAGIKILNMYGLTETSPVITINRQNPPDRKLGTVGALIEGVEIKIAEDGEILCRGHNVMIGYYKDPEMTKSVFDKDGWFHTGDIGYLEDGKFLVVTDRKKEIFKLSSGKFIAPQLIENKLKESVSIEQLMVLGEHEKFASALIMPNFQYLEEWCRENNYQFATRKEMIGSDVIYRLVKKEIDGYNKNTSKSEQVLKFKLVEDEWSPASGELSPTLKLKRKFIDQKYKTLIETIYSKQVV